MPDAVVNFSLLHRTCSLVVVLCFLHISVTLIYYMRNSDSRQSFVQNQQNPQIHRKLTEQKVTTEEIKLTSLSSVTNITETQRKLETCPDNPPSLGEFRFLRSIFNVYLYECNNIVEYIICYCLFRIYFPQ